MGAIYLGKKLGMGGFEREVVLKQLLPEYTEQPEFIDLFLREARLSASLDHANIVHTIDLVAAGTDYFIVMEYVRGGDLRTLLRRSKRRGKRWKPETAIFIGREVLGALAYAHAKTGPDGQPLNLIHRDVSPSNILLSHNGEVKLTDFGIAKANTHRSVFYRVKGKVGYMSPEQAHGERLDHRSDLYSCAVCLYEILTGERLFVGDISMTAEQIYSHPIPRLSEKRRGIPPELDQVMLKALALDPNRRFQSAVEFSDALLKVAHKNQLMFAAPDLAVHLRELCGEEVSAWMGESVVDEDESDARPSTELYDARREGSERLRVSQVSQFTGRELTSVLEPSGTFVPGGASLTGLFTSVGEPPPARAEFDEATHHYPHSRRDAPSSAQQTLRRSQSAPRRNDARPTARVRGTLSASGSGPARALAALAAKLQTSTPKDGSIDRNWVAAAAVLAALGVGVAAAVALTRPDLPLTIEEEPLWATARTSPKPSPGPTATPVPAPTPTVTEAPPAEPAAAPLDAATAAHEAHGSAAAGRGATLWVTSLPQASTVLLDGRLMCATPCRIRDLAREPLYHLKVAHAGHVAWSSLIDLRDRDSDRLTALLRPEPPADQVGYLKVRSTRVAEIFVDGKEVGAVTDDDAVPLKPGRYALSLRHPRSSAKPNREVTVARGKTIALDLELR